MKPYYSYFLPNWFKKIGILTIVASFVIPVTIGILKLWPPHAGVLGINISKLLFLLGLLFIVFSKEKVEDEFVTDTRLTSTFGALIGSILVYLISIIVPFVRLEPLDYSGFELLVVQLGGYIIVFNIKIAHVLGHGR